MIFVPSSFIQLSEPVSHVQRGSIDAAQKLGEPCARKIAAVIILVTCCIPVAIVERSNITIRFLSSVAGADVSASPALVYVRARPQRGLAGVLFHLRAFSPVSASV
jgi:hypothetical protein